MKYANAILALAVLLLCVTIQPTFAQAGDDPSFEDVSVTLDVVNRSDLKNIVDFVPMSEIQIAKLLDEAEAFATGKTQPTTEFLTQLLEQYKAWRGAYDRSMFQTDPTQPTEAKTLDQYEAREDWGVDDDALFASVINDEPSVRPEVVRAIVSGYWELVVSFMQKGVLDSMNSGSIPVYKTSEGSDPLGEAEFAQASETLSNRIPATIAKLRKVLVAE